MNKHLELVQQASGRLEPQLMMVPMLVAIVAPQQMVVPMLVAIVEPRLAGRVVDKRQGS